MEHIFNSRKSERNKEGMLLPWKKMAEAEENLKGGIF